MEGPVGKPIMTKTAISLQHFSPTIVLGENPTLIG